MGKLGFGQKGQRRVREEEQKSHLLGGGATGSHRKLGAERGKPELSLRSLLWQLVPSVRRS